MRAPWLIKRKNLHITRNAFDEAYFHVTGGFLIEIVFMLSVSYFLILSKLLQPWKDAFILSESFSKILWHYSVSGAIGTSRGSLSNGVLSSGRLLIELAKREI